MKTLPHGAWCSAAWLMCLLSLLSVGILSGCGAAASAAPTSVAVRTPSTSVDPSLDTRALQLAREVWSALHTSTNTCDEFDYFPSGGVRSFACHIFSLVSFDRIVQTAGAQPFVSGPHAQGLNLRAAGDFGHYNPAFVRFMARHAVPAQQDSTFRAATQGHYDMYVAPLARILYATHKKLQENPTCAAAEREEYAGAIARSDTQDYVEPWFFFMNDTYCQHRRGDYDDYEASGFDGGYDGNVVKTAVGFWLRRSLDGTDSVFFEGLETLMNTYEPAGWR